MPEISPYDPGYLPGDPRHGLSPGAIADFYRTRPAQWLVRGVYGPNAAEKRAGAVDAHSAFIRANIELIRFAGPLFADDGVARTGTWFLFDAPDRGAVEKLMEGEGFNRAGMFAEIEILRFVETSFDERRQTGTRPDPALQMFLCEMIDGPDAAEIRNQIGPAHHRHEQDVADRLIIRGPVLSDDAARVIGATYIVQAEDHVAAKALIADGPLARAGAYSKMRIGLWRFGATIG